MSTSRLRSRLAWVLALALAADAAGCCEIREHLVEVREADSPTPWGSDVTCAARCPLLPSCGVDRLARCTVDGPVGSRVAACVYEATECPDRPLPFRSDCGRRHPGAAIAPACADDPVGARFAAMAALEAASVPAFEALGDALAAHDAPPRLQRAARRAAEDERRHARAMGALATRRGAEVARVDVVSAWTPTLRELAHDNAVEGCVRETFGALVALWQSERADDPSVRATMRAIARDELRHAALGWRVDAWAAARLDDDARASVAAAKRAAIDALRASLPTSGDGAVSRAGFPSRPQALRLLDACVALVWTEAA